MMEYKFRFYDKEDKLMRYFTLDEMLERHFSYYGSYDLKVLTEEKSQYTGLKDKNKKEIYAGDIVKHKLDGMGVVRFHNSWGAFYYSMIKGRDEYGDVVKMTASYPFYNESSNYEIIGNIYENSELLR